MKNGSALLGLAELGAGIALNATGVAVPLGQKLTVMGGMTLAGGIASSMQRQTQIGRGSDLGTNTNDTLIGMPIPYGTSVVGFQRMAATTHAPGATTRRYLWLVGALSHGPIGSVDQVYLDGHLALQSFGPYLRSTWDGTNQLHGTPKDDVASPNDYRQVVAGWVAHGTDGQKIAVMNQRGPMTVSRLQRNAGNKQFIEFTTDHPYAVGDCITPVTPVAGLAPLTGYIVTDVVSSNSVRVYNAGGAPGTDATSGTMDFYCPDLWNLFFTPEMGNTTQLFTPDMTGKGVCWLVLRLSYPSSGAFDWNGGTIPRITAVVSGLVGEDTASRGATTLTVSSIAPGAALSVPAFAGSGTRNLYDSTALVTFGASHNLSEGQIVRFRNTATSLDGVQRVDRVLSDTQVQVFCEGVAATTTAGTAAVLSEITNPIIAVREYLTNPNYGPGCATTELDDTRFTTEANYCDQLVSAPSLDTVTHVNTTPITATAVDGANTALTVATDTSYYPVGCTVLVVGTSQSAANGYHQVVSRSAGTLVINVTTTGAGTGGTVQRQVQQAQFTCAGQLNSNNSLKSNVEALLATCRGRLILQGGQYAPSIRRPTTLHPLRLTPDLMLGPVTWTLPGQRDLANLMRATAVNTPGYLDTLSIVSTTPVSASTNIVVHAVSGYAAGNVVRISGVKIAHTHIGKLDGITTITLIDETTNTITVPVATTAAGTGGSMRKLADSGVIISSSGLGNTFTTPFGIDGQYSQIFYPTGGAENNIFLTDDGGQLNLKDVDLPLVNNPPRAQQILQVMMREARAALGMTVICSRAALQYQVDDLVPVTHETPGFVDTPFWVTSIALLPDNTVQVVLEAYDATAYDLSAQDDVHFPFTTLATLNAPTSLTAVPFSDDGSECFIQWVPGSGLSTTYVTDVFVRAQGAAFNTATRVDTIAPTSTQYTIPSLIPGGAYTASVQHRNPATGAVSVQADVDFTTSATSAVLEAPTDATGFSGSQDPSFGFPQQDGVYGLAVVALELPGSTEFFEAVETSIGSGTYGAAVSVGVVASVQGNWTLYENIAPNDGLRRTLTARAIRDGATSSAFTAGVVVAPWTSEPLELYALVPFLSMRVDLFDSNSVQMTCRVFVADPAAAAGHPITILVKELGVLSVVPMTDSLVYPTDPVTSNLDTTAFRDFVINRPPAGSPQGRVTFTAERDGRLPVVQSVDVLPKGQYLVPTPTITYEAEGTALGGDGEGRLHLKLVFEFNTDQFWVYATESSDATPPVPDLTDNMRSAVVSRHEGTLASGDNWATEQDISTTTGFNRRFIVIPIGPTGLRGQPVTGVVPCVDTGTGPSGPPTAFTVTFDTVSGLSRASLAWTNGDAGAAIRVWRNGIVLTRLAAGTTTFVDTGLSPAILYSYNVQHILSGQTSEFADTTGSTTAPSDTPTLVAPDFDAGFPKRGGYDDFGHGLVRVRVTNPDPLASTQVFMSRTNADSGIFDLVYTFGPGQTDTSLDATDMPFYPTPDPTDDMRWFYVVATRPSYTNSAASAHQTALFGA